MDQMRAVDAEADAQEDEPALDERLPAIGGDERRMHVRAYNFWVSLLDGRAYPAIADLDPAAAGDFGEHGVLLDFTGGGDNPSITYLGARLREACGIEGAIDCIADVPSRTLLSRLTDHYLQILANRAPIGFEAEFVDHRGLPMLYRGILMPFSSDDERIDHVYGVINWKTLAAAADLAGPVPALVPAIGAAPWADGPGAALAGDGPANTLATRLAAMRDGAMLAEAARIDCRAALNDALGLAYNFMLAATGAPDEHARLLAASGTRSRSGARAAIMLAFGRAIGAERTAELADALAHARRIGVPEGGLVRRLEGERGGARAFIAAERAIRESKQTARARRKLRLAPAASNMPTITGGAFALFLTRGGATGEAEIVGRIDNDSGLVDEAVRKIARRRGSAV